MPADEYTSFSGGGALKLKGAKVKKHKKKKDKTTDLEKALSTGDGTKPEASPGAEEDDGERRLEKRSRARDSKLEDEDEPPETNKTEAERRFAEVKRKKLLEMVESAAARPELLKSHKERVEELNTYLSKLSEHHDMPKIGPG